MKTDKNTVIGFLLLGILFFTMFWYNNKMSQASMAQEKARIDSVEKIKTASITPEMKIKQAEDSARKDTTNRIAQAKGFGTNAAIGKEEFATMENELMKITFSNRGGRLKFVTLKNYKSYDSSLVTLGSSNDKVGYAINTGGGNATQTNELFFSSSPVAKNADGSQTIHYNLKDSAGSSVTHQFTIRPNDYMVDWNIDLDGADRLLTNSALNINWHIETQQHEKSASYERAQMSNICFLEDKEFDYISSKTERKFEKPVQWVGAVQQFFNTTLIAKNNFNTGNVVWARHNVDTSHLLATVDGSFQIKIPAGTKSIPMQMYYGPNDFNILKKQAPEMDKIVNLGRDMYSFVRPINKFIIMPVFNFFASFIKNYGWVILLLTLFIRLVTAPLTYTSYLSGAKMKVLRPELDILKKKFGTDQQGFAMEQMKLFREAGVNPLGGCIPALLQIPIFFALYSFFNSNIALRGQEFLWSKDLSAFDNVIHWQSEIWAIGNHVSLFTITAVLTSFLISIYNMSMTPTQDNPALKYMPYIFPFVLFFVFNKLPSALTWYYTVSNIITLGLQFVIQNYIINHDKILAKMEEKRKAPKKGPSKWQERLQQVQEGQKKMQEMKNRNQNKK
ncbi:MAG: membrane protein insertase YidC [Chitinophagaceae bacterium]|nr:membrane protein insertase YidC [Chitinophagaceae bacterium]